MRAALIPPRGYYNYATRSDIHLVLAQVCDPTYVGVYQYDVSADDHIIVDNGAAEGQMVQPDILFEKAYLYGADEIVLPDVLGSADATIDAVDSFMKEYSKLIETAGHSFMGVVQAQGDMGSVIKCIRHFADIPRIKTLGVPRHLNTESDVWMRDRILTWIRNNGFDKRFRVHLLGTSPIFPSEILHIARRHPWVRSVDSSMPFNYTAAGVALDATTRVHRPEGYFERNWNLWSELLDKNIKTYMEWARGIEGTRS